ncbi:MAG: hypothetical protein ACHQSE_05730 [Gemmatimonadales bacterium]
MTNICQRALFALVAASAALSAQEIPSRLADTTYWRLVTELSEPSGNFPSDNLLSNETSLQYVIPDLVRDTKPGGVYLGVAPEQNFTYLAALKPKIAFIVDIRHDNSMLLLVYKALFEMSADRAEFTSRLFSRPRPAGLDTASTIERLMQAYSAVPKDSALFVRNLAAVKERLQQVHGFPLTKDELASIDYVYAWFYHAGPDLSYNMNMGGYRSRYPTYAMLMLETDATGAHRSYLASESNFRVVKEMEGNNLIVGVTGDFTGPKALRAVGSYVREHHATITAFYVSNVEFYLFRQGDDWKHFYDNVATLPLDSSSTFIRSLSQGYTFRPEVPRSPNGAQMELLCSMQSLLKAYNEGKISYYMDMINLSKQ